MKKLSIKLTGKTKKVVISVSAGAAAVAIVAGIVFGLRGRGEPVGVYPFSMVGMTEFWGDNQESYGPVTTDRIQTVFLSDTQTITGVLVNEGDTVKKGDVLMTYDTSLSELQLERKRLDVEKANLQVKEAQEELARINKLEPMGNVETSVDIPAVSTNYGRELKEAYEIATTEGKYDGSTPEKAVVCWLKDSTPVNNALLRQLYYQAMMNQIANAEKEPSSGSAIPQSEDGGQTDSGETPPQDTDNPKGNTGEQGGNTDNQGGDTGNQGGNADNQGGSTDNQGGNTGNQGGNTDNQGSSTDNQDGNTDNKDNADKPAAETPPPTPAPVSEPDAFTLFAMRAPATLSIWTDVSKEGTVQVYEGDAVTLTFTSSVTDWQHSDYVTWSLTPKGGPLQGYPNGKGYTVSGVTSAIGQWEYTVTADYQVDGIKPLTASRSFKLNVIPKPTEDTAEVNSFYTVLKVTEGNLEKAPCTTWQGLKVTVYEGGGGFGFSFCDVPSQDYFFPEGAEGDTSFPDIDFGSGMTAAEIAKLRREQEKKIKELTASAAMTQSEYNLMLREFSDGNIRATLDGQVVSLITEEEARQNKLPVMKVSGGGGFYVQGSVSELEKEKLKIGQEVTINDWNTGMMYTGTVESIGDFPVQGEGWNGMGNPDASYYPFRVFIDGTADLQEGSYVSVTYSAAEAENGIYLENPFLRTDEGEPYVYVRGKNGKLEKRTVTTGKSLWGSYTEIRSGLTADDYVAFPYGKTVKPGAATQESDLSALYGY